MRGESRARRILIEPIEAEHGVRIADVQGEQHLFLAPSLQRSALSYQFFNPNAFGLP
jgi:hypothetical protein